MIFIFTQIFIFKIDNVGSNSGPLSGGNIGNTYPGVRIPYVSDVIAYHCL
jgi:hypothetical protein